MSILQVFDTERRSLDFWRWESEARPTHRTAYLTKSSAAKNVTVAYIGPRGEEPTEAVVIKFAHQTQNGIQALWKEYGVYEGKLKHLQGTVVPRCYGLYRGKKDGRDIACLVLEYCKGHHNFSLSNLNHQIMLAICKIHEAGILHGSLDDGHHIICSNTGVRIVDFANAIENHRCKNAIPILNDSRGTIASNNGCPELILMEKCFGIIDLDYGGPVSTSRRHMF